APISTLFPYTTLFRSLRRYWNAKPTFISKGDGESLSVVNGVLYRRLKVDTLLGPSKSGAFTYVRNKKMNLFVINCLRNMDIFYRSEEHTSELQSRENL